jgi:hypothetical protein
MTPEHAARVCEICPRVRYLCRYPADDRRGARHWRGRSRHTHSVDSRRIRTMMSHAHRRQSSETAGPFSNHPQPRVAAASERHGIAFRAHGIDAGPSPAKPDPPNGIAVPRRTSPGKNRSARHVAAETQLSRQAARRARLLQHGGDPDPGRGGGEAAEPRAREPCRRTHAHRQPDQERARTPRHPRLRPTLCTAAQRLERLPTPEKASRCRLTHWPSCGPRGHCCACSPTRSGRSRPRACNGWNSSSIAASIRWSDCWRGFGVLASGLQTAHEAFSRGLPATPVGRTDARRWSGSRACRMISSLGLAKKPSRSSSRPSACALASAATSAGAVTNKTE